MLGYGVMASVAALVLYVAEPATAASVALMIWLSAGSLLYGVRRPGRLGVALAAANALALVMAAVIGVCWAKEAIG